MRAIELAGLHAYSDQISVEAGERIAFHVSASIPYTAALCRLGPDTTGPSQDEALATEACRQPAVQPIHPGSCIHVKNGLPAAEYPELAFECWIKIWGLASWQTIFSQMDHSGAVDGKTGIRGGSGVGLFIDPDGHAVLGWNGELLRSPHPIPLGQWIHMAATFNSGQTEIWIDGTCIARSQADHTLVLPDHPLRLGACGVRGRSDLFLEGDLAMPALYSAALDRAAILGRVEARALARPRHPGLICCWPLNELRGTHVQACGSSRYAGQLINHGTRGINGPAFDPAEIPRYRDHALAGDGLHAEPARAGVRFASDDLVDCGWSATHEFTVPADARSGLYVGRFEFDWNGAPARYDVTFVVRRARLQPAPKLLVLCATNTWMAYSASPFADTHAQPATWPRRCAGLPTTNPLVPTHCTYNFHRAGQPSYYVGVRMPRPNAAPYELYAPEGSGFAQWVRLERQLHVWLDRHGYDYDVVADVDVHRDPALLQRYRAVIINGHSEYWSKPAYQGLEDYLGGGGRAIVLSGNSMYWRVSFDEDCTVMEQRKTRTPHDTQDADAVAAPAGPHGEQYHSQDGERGGLWRFSGQSCARLIGLETAGWGFARAEDFGVFRVKDASHALFNEPFATGMKNGDTFGHGPSQGLPRAVGHEWDVTTATLMRMTRHLPHDADEPEPQESIHVIAEGVRSTPGPLDAYLDYFEQPVESLDGLSCEMIIWNRPAGGQVFNAGAVGASWVLEVDDRMGKLLANTLSAFEIGYPESGPYLKNSDR